MALADVMTGDIMKPIASFIQEGTQMIDVVANMVKNSHGAAVVVSQARGKFRGIVTSEEIVDILGRRGGEEQLKELSVDDLMIESPTVNSLTSLEKVAGIMDKQHLQYLVVVDEQYCPVGIISRKDIVWCWAENNCNTPP